MLIAVIRRMLMRFWQLSVRLRPPTFKVVLQTWLTLHKGCGTYFFGKMYKSRWRISALRYRQGNFDVPTDRRVRTEKNIYDARSNIFKKVCMYPNLDPYNKYVQRLWLIMWNCYFLSVHLLSKKIYIFLRFWSGPFQYLEQNLNSWIQILIPNADPDLYPATQFNANPGPDPFPQPCVNCLRWSWSFNYFCL